MAKKQMAKKRSSNTKNDKGSPAASFKSEVILWSVLAASIILFLSNFGIAGRAGRAVSGIFFGLFGLSAYIFPIVLFAGTAFIISNRDNRIAVIKASASAVFFLFLCMFLELITGSRKAASPFDSFAWAAEHRLGGGFAGGLLTWLIRPNLGTVSAYVIAVAVLIICVVLITQRSIWKHIQSGGRKVYVSAKNETLRQHEQHEQRRKQRRMDRKVTGVSTDTSIKDLPRTGASDNISEIYPEPASAQDFPIHVMEQSAQEQETLMRQEQAAVGMERPPELMPFPLGAGISPAAKKDGGQEAVDNIIPIANQKITLQPNLPEDHAQGHAAEADAEKQNEGQSEGQKEKKSPAVEMADDILAHTSELFSELLPDIADTEPAGETGELSAGGGGGAASFSEQDAAYAAAAEDGTYAAKDWADSGTHAAAKDAAHSGTYAAAKDAADSGTYAAAEDGVYAAEKDAAGSGTYAAAEDAAYAAAEDAGMDLELPPMAAGGSAAQQLQEAETLQAGTAASKDSAAAHAGRRENAADAGALPAGPAASSKRAAAAAQAETAAAAADMDIRLRQPPARREYVLPSADLLKRGDPNKTGDSRRHLQETALKLQQTLKNFGVNVTILNVSCGPAVTRYEIQPEMGVKVSKIVNLADDIKLNLAAADIRIEAPIPGKAAIGIEVPNKENVPVMFRDLVESEQFRQSRSPCTFAAGKDIAGQAVVTDICRMPHLLIAGATGSGKSVCINTIIMSIIYKADPEDVKMIMIDPKVVELSVYNGIPHLLLPVVTDPKKAAGALHWAVAEMMDRYQKFADCGVRDMKGYNAKINKLEGIAEENKPQKMPYIVIIVDELADLMMAAPGDVEDAICRLAQLARAAGIHLIIATQRPSVNVITGLIKANMPSRIAFSVTSGIDSRTILDMNGAEKLLGKGDMLFYPQGYQKPVRVQGAFVSDSEVSKVVSYLTEQNGVSQYSSDIEEKVTSAASGSGTASPESSAADDRDVYFADAAKLLIDKDKASVSMLQRYFKIGFNRAARIMDQLEEAGVVGEEEGTKPRKILMSPEEFAQYEEEVL